MLSSTMRTSVLPSQQRNVGPCSGGVPTPCPLRSPVQPQRTSHIASATTRAPSAYSLFTKDRYKQVMEDLKKQKKEAKLGDVTNVIRDEWKKMNDKSKQPYVSQANKRKEEVASAKAEEKKNAGPAKPPTSYAQFTKEMFPHIKAKSPGAKLPEITKQISQMWKAMPEAEKKKRTDEAHARLDEYKKAKEAHAAQANGTN
ncbi:hypothetical protein DUNSADRAFT_8879 [Dunaliella salina]|uniref:HMG box domain-containing protein n=1 Tax=Dunaliella salina TaxID=3046 RepID=A0ABQ7GIK5_DUNSA|nr:hypothetical protein DUNSADRAFT_8879 [Dunaliella salina]|eukprot:KAF5834451.1 hypothetical protein DUNSADRAFT_8879 [Dunaliella salina]